MTSYKIKWLSKLTGKNCTFIKDHYNKQEYYIIYPISISEENKIIEIIEKETELKLRSREDYQLTFI